MTALQYQTLVALIATNTALLSLIAERLGVSQDEVVALQPEVDSLLAQTIRKSEGVTS